MEPWMQIKGACLTVTLPPEVDHPVSDRIRNESDKILADRYVSTMVFDFQNTTFMDSSGIGLLMGRYKVLGMRSKSIRAVNVGSHVEKLLRLAGVHKYIEICRQK